MTTSAPRVALVFGTRPEAIKMCPVVLALRARGATDVRVCATGQHRHMLDQVLTTFDIQPDADLQLMSANQGLAALASRALASLDSYLEECAPDLVLVQGDTTTAFCAALAAFYRGIDVAHVEAGLRTWDLAAPFPEEANRTLLTRLAMHHFAPTETARANLLREGVQRERIEVTGNTVIDALLLAADRAAKTSPEIPGLGEDVMAPDGAALVLVTGHRRESFGQGFESICAAIRELARRFPLARFVYPVHLNPNVQGPVHRLLAGVPNVHLIAPLEYLPFIRLMGRATLLLTDSGGVQEEGPSLHKPILVMRDTTERPGDHRGGRGQARRNHHAVNRRGRLTAPHRPGGPRRHDPGGQPLWRRQGRRENRQELRGSRATPPVNAGRRRHGSLRLRNCVRRRRATVR